MGLSNASFKFLNLRFLCSTGLEGEFLLRLGNGLRRLKVNQVNLELFYGRKFSFWGFGSLTLYKNYSNRGDGVYSV